MPPPNKTPHSPDESNVHPIKRGVGTLQPPGGREWKPRNELGQFMRFKPGEGGRLVRLADVMRWLEEAMSREAALKVLCDGLAPDVMGCLYKVEKAKDPELIPSDALFGWPSTTGNTKNNDPTSSGSRRLINLRKGFVRDW